MKSRIKTYIFSIAFFILCNTYAQQADNDDAVSESIKLRNELDNALANRKYSDVISIAKKIERYSITHKDSAFWAHSHSIRAEIYKFKSNLGKAKFHVKSALSIYKNLKWYNNLVELNTSLSYMYQLEGKIDSSAYVLNLVKSYISDSTKNKSLSYYYTQKSKHFVKASRLDSAIHFSYKSLKISDPKNKMATTINHYGISKLFYRANDYKKAMLHIDKALQAIADSDMELKLTKYNVLIAKCKILFKIKAFKQARKLTLEALELVKDGNHTDYSVQATTLLSKLDFKEIANPTILDVLSDTVIVNKKVNNTVLAHFHLTQLEQYQALNQTAKAEAVINKLKSIITKIGSLGLKQMYYKKAARHWENKQNFKKSFKNQSAYLAISKKINDRQKLYAFYDLDTKYQTAKKDQEIAKQNLKLQKQHTQNNYMKGIALFLLLSSILTWLFFKQRQKRKNQEIVTLKREHQIKTLETLIEGEEKERYRIAKELHDGVNGDLSAIKYKLSSLLEMNNNVINEAITMIDNSCNQVRAISHNLVPPSLENFNLLETVEDYCQKLDDLHTQKITFQHLGDDIVNLSKKEEINSYRIIQELVSNSLKHANATSIDVQLSCRNNSLQITVEDNGIGFDEKLKTGDGIGLSNIQSRVAYLNATVDFISNKQGTSYTIEIDKN
ncbi:MAG: sensor histidine kinase [Flavobacteriaceae bacterium]